MPSRWAARVKLRAWAAWTNAKSPDKWSMGRVLIMTECHYNLDRGLIPFVALAMYRSSTRQHYYGGNLGARSFAMRS